MTTRSMDRPPNGQASPDRKRTTQSLIAAIGATGAVLAGGAVGFVFLIGVVSFNAYPKASDEIEGPAAELQVVPLNAAPAAPAELPGEQTGDTTPFDVGPPLPSFGPLPSSGAVAGSPDLGRDISEPKPTGDGPPVVVVAPPAPGDGGSSDPTTGAGSEEPLPQDPGGEDDPIVEPSPDPGGGQSGGSPPTRPLVPNTPNAPPAPPAIVPSTPQTGAATGPAPTGDESFTGDDSESAGGLGSSTGE